MASKFDIPLHGPSVSIVRRCGSALSDVLQSKFGCVATISGVNFEDDSSIAQQKRPIVAREKRFECTLAAGVKVSVWKADLTNFPVDAVVNAANDRLQHYGGLALALSNAGGLQIQKDSDDYISKHGDLKTGQAVVSDAGLLPCKKIIHAVGPQLSRHPSKSDVSQAEPLLKKVICSILERVKEKHLKTVAIPAISSGLFNFPLQLCADTIVAMVKHYYENSSGHRPKEILFVNNDEPTVKEMERACHQILTPQMTYSQAAASKNQGYAKTSTTDAKTSTTVQIGSVQLTLKTGCIENQQTDVIVNTTFNRNLSRGQISNAILEKAGPGIQQEMYNGPLTGYIIITKPYKLQCKEVYHTSCTVKGKDTEQEILFKSVSECLWMAAKSHKSIAFPAIGTGGLGIDKKKAAQIMSDAVAGFARNFPKKMDIYFIIFPSDKDTFKAFEEQMRHLEQRALQPNFSDEFEHRDDFQGSRALTPQISLSGPSEEATREAERWLHDLLFKSYGTVVISNNFIQHFGEREHLQLSRLMEKGVSITELFERGRASIIVQGGSNEDAVVAALQVEAILCNIQREFFQEEESAMVVMLSKNVSFERKKVDCYTPEFSDRLSAFNHTGLRVVKVDRVENTSLKMLFDLKKKQLNCSKSEKMFQWIPAHFCNMVSHIGFHAEFAPPDDPAYGEGIYFTSTVKKAKEVWKEPNKEYLHFVEAEVLTGNSTPGKPGLILPPAVREDPQSLYDSVSGPEIAVIFSGCQALPKYIITVKII